MQTFYSVKKLKQLRVCQIQQQKKINQRDSEKIRSVMLQLTSNQMACSDIFIVLT